MSENKQQLFSPTLVGCHDFHIGTGAEFSGLPLVVIGKPRHFHKWPVVAVAFAAHVGIGVLAVASFPGIFTRGLLVNRGEKRHSQI